MSKYLVFIALHKRLDITRVVFENLKLLRDHYDLDVFGVCSAQEEADLCSEYGFDYTIEENSPLGRKLNRGLIKAMRKDFEYLLQLGSDDIITSELLNIYEGLDYDYYGLNAYHMVDPKTKRAKKFIYGGRWNPIMHPVGAGRVFKKKALEKVLLRDDLWEDKAERVLDHLSDIVMLRNGFRAKIIDFNGVGIIDIKSDENIWPFDEVGSCEPYDYEELEGYLC